MPRAPTRPRPAPVRIPTDPLALFRAPSVARILGYFVLRPDAQPHARLLQRVLHLGGASLQRDLQRLERHGILRRIPDGRLVRYAAAPRPNFWAAVRLLIGETSDPASLVAAALCDVEGIRAAFVFGSTAAGTDVQGSDVDVFVLETRAIDARALYRQLAEAALVLEREVNVVRYAEQALAERLGDRAHPGHAFVRNVLAGPRRELAGTLAALHPLATAAGIPMPVNDGVMSTAVAG